MISLWIPVKDTRHEFCGNITKHQIVRYRKNKFREGYTYDNDIEHWHSQRTDTHSIGSIFQIVPKFYNSFQIKRIYQDKVKKEDTNLAIIRTSSIGNGTGKRRWNWEDIKKWCDWCLDNDIQPALDDSWESGSPFVRPKSVYHQVKDYLIKNKIKIITNVPRIHDKFKWDNDIDPCFQFDTDDMFINFDTFYYLTRYQHQMFNNDFKMRIHPTFYKNKKYLFTTLIGDILKKRNTALLGSLYYNDLIDENCFYTSILESDIPKEWEDKYSHIEVEKYVNENKEKIFKHKPFDDKDQLLDMITERRIPQELYDSHFAINVESSDHTFFFTEKTFKNVIAKIPFISFGGPYFSAGLKEHHGFERFEEIFDYSYEDKIPKNTTHGKHIEGIINNVKRLKKEPVSIFSQPSVREKLDYNEYIYFKKTTDVEVEIAIENLFHEILK